MATKKHKNTWFVTDDDYDYSAEIQKAVDEGNFAKAAYLEKGRNAKIDFYGMPYEQTYQYQDYLPTVGNKNDGSVSAVPSFNDSSYGKKANRILNRAGAMNFHYNANNDPLYKQIKQNYQNTVNDVIDNTMGSYAGMTGGVPSSYAASAAAQAGAQHLQKADDMIPELYQLAYNKYADDKADLYRQYGIYSDLENRDYTRELYDRERQHGLDREAISDERYNTEWQHGLDREAVSDERYDAETARAEKEARKESVLDALGLGIPPNDEYAQEFFGMSGDELLTAYKNYLVWKQDPTAVPLSGTLPSGAAQGVSFGQFVALQGSDALRNIYGVIGNNTEGAVAQNDSITSYPVPEQSSASGGYDTSYKLPSEEEMYADVLNEEFQSLLPYYDDPATGGSGSIIIDFNVFTPQEFEAAKASGKVYKGEDGRWHLKR